MKSTARLLNFITVFAVFATNVPAGSAQPAPADAAVETVEELIEGQKKGEAVARVLIELGDAQLYFHMGGLPGVTRSFQTTSNLAVFLEQKHGIKCITREIWLRYDFERGYAESFNQIMLAHLEAQYGEGFIYKAEEAAAAVSGQANALKEIAEGRLALETYGLPSRTRGPYIDLLKTKYDIQLRAVAGCIVDSTITGHARGFNEVMMTEIEKRFGADALAKAEAEADKLAERSL
jgi:hypothetical protein